MQVQELVGIVPWTFIAQICNLFLQVYLIKRFLFKPINNILAKRKEMADAQIQDAVKAREEAEAMKSQYEQDMIQAKNKANENSWFLLRRLPPPRVRSFFVRLPVRQLP